MKIAFRNAGLLLVLLSLVIFVGCGGSSSGSVRVTEQDSKASDGLDLQAVGEMAKKTKNAETFEAELNKPDGINNLDLDEDDKVDYINVKEFGDEKAPDDRGFSLTTEIAGETQEVATIQFEREVTTNQATMNIAGNQNIYGANHYYQDRFSLSDAIFMAWLFSPRAYYVSPYYGGIYPVGYVRYASVSPSVYTTRRTTYTRGSTIQQSRTSSLKTPLTSPNAGKTATNIRATLSNPSATQKSFQQANPTKRMNTGGGFGGTKTSNPTSKPSGPAYKPSAPASRPSAPAPSRRK